MLPFPLLVRPKINRTELSKILRVMRDSARERIDENPGYGECLDAFGKRTEDEWIAFISKSVIKFDPKLLLGES